MNLSEKFLKILKKKFTMTNTQMMEKLKNVSVYKRIMPKLGINFSSKKSQHFLKESIEEGCANSYFPLADQFQTQADPTFCGPTTMVCVFNALGVDPRRKWKGIWRWYLEGVIKCLDVDKTKDFGMTLEEFCIIAKCNGVFTEAYRPDGNEQETEKQIMFLLNNNDSELSDINYLNKNEVIKHDETNSECKNNFELLIKTANEDFFRTCVYASTRRENLFLVTNTSRVALKQTGDGHFSPVAAYHPETQHLLVMDAARFKYNSMWFTIAQVFNAFCNLDKATQKPRGFILCSRYYYHLPRICKFSLDLECSDYLKDFLKLIKDEMKSNLNIEHYFECLITNSHILNDIRIQSLLLSYYNELENRSSFLFNEEYTKEFIKYNNDNVDISKEQIFKSVRHIKEKFNKIVLKEMHKENNNLTDFIKFLFYLDNKQFVDFLTFFVTVTYMSIFPNQTELCLDKYEPAFQKEVKIMIESLGL